VTAAYGRLPYSNAATRGAPNRDDFCLTSTAPRLPLPVPVVADGKAAGAAMDPFIDEIVRRSIRHARLMLKEGAYNWPVARLALRKILADLEESAPDDPSLPRLRTFIASQDRAWLHENP
jgi:hypothetical protein